MPVTCVCAKFKDLERSWYAIQNEMLIADAHLIYSVVIYKQG